MSVSISWTHSWSSSDDGTILYGADLQNLQTNIEAHTHTEDVETTGDQTVGGIKTLSGTLNITGIFQIGGTTIVVVSVDEFLCWENDAIAYENNLVYYR